MKVFEATSVGRFGRVLEFMRLLWGLDHALQVRSKAMGRRLGITGPQRLVLRIVGQLPGIRAGQLADILLLHRSTMTGILKRLETKGLLERRIDPEDGRRALFVLGRKGRRLNAIQSGTIEASVRRTLARLTLNEIVVTSRVVELLRIELEGKG